MYEEWTDDRGDIYAIPLLPLSIFRAAATLRWILRRRSVCNTSEINTLNANNITSHHHKSQAITGSQAKTMDSRSNHAIHRCGGLSWENNASRDFEAWAWLT